MRKININKVIKEINELLDYNAVFNRGLQKAIEIINNNIEEYESTSGTLDKETEKRLNNYLDMVEDRDLSISIDDRVKAGIARTV